MSERVIVCGGRDYQDRARVQQVLDVLHHERGIQCIIEGGAAGADYMARCWALCRKDTVEHIRVPAEWGRHGKAAGPIRNSEMLRFNPSLVIAFPGGKGTEDMVTKAQRAGVEVWRIDAPARSAVSPDPVSDSRSV